MNTKIDQFGILATPACIDDINWNAHTEYQELRVWGKGELRDVLCKFGQVRFCMAQATLRSGRITFEAV